MLDPKSTASQKQSVNYNPTELIAVLRKRLAGLKQAYDQLENHVHSLEAAKHNVQQQLEETQNELRRWQSNRGVRLSRTLTFLRHNLQQSLVVSSNLVAQTVKYSIKAQLDTPLTQAVLEGELDIRGWVAGTVPGSLHIEIWLNETRLGLAEYGLPRWDVIENQPWQSQPDCGFAGRFKLDPLHFKAGKATIKVRFLKDSPEDNLEVLEIERPVRIKFIGQSDQQLYQAWLQRTGMIGWDFLAQRAAIQKWSYQPLLSLVITPSMSVVPAELAALLDSIQAQTYQYWEIQLHLPALVATEIKNLAETYAHEDNRIHIQLSTLTSFPNFLALLDTVRGDYLAVPESDALLSQDAFFKVVRFLNQHQNTTVLYSDEDVINAAGERSQPQFKPDWSPEFFFSRPYIGQLTFYQRETVQELSGFGVNNVEIAACELALRLFEKTGPFQHLPEIIYHSRHPLDLRQPLKSEISEVLYQHFKRTGQTATIGTGMLPATLHYRYTLAKQPNISIIIPTRDQSQVLRRCLDSILERTTYTKYEVIVVDNASHEAETLQYFTELVPNLRVKRLRFEGPFNFSAINNFAVTQAKGDLLVFLNNDTEVITPDWLEELAAFAAQSEIGAVGARLLYPIDTIQHAGVVVGLMGVADHILKGLTAEAPGPLGLAKTVKNVSALTAACLMTRRDLFLKVGGFDEQNLPVAFNDVDYCLKLRELGLRLVWTPYAELYHHESVSRGLDSSIEKEARLHQEITYMFGRWPEPIAHDPYYNPNLSRNRLDATVSER